MFLTNGEPWLELYRFDGNGYLLRFPSLADFTVSANGVDVAACPAPGVSPQTIEHLYLNQVLPMALSRQFKLVLHASAVEIDDFAVAFMGESGRGKSTLAARFATSGHRFLTDDGLQIENSDAGLLVAPSHASIRLWNDSREALIPVSTHSAPPVDFTPKTRFLAGDEVAHCNVSRPLRCVYLLGKASDDRVSIEPLGGREAMIELVRHSFLLDIEERQMLERHFHQLSDLVKTVAVSTVNYPRKYESLPSVHYAIIRHARAQPGAVQVPPVQ